MKMPGSSLLASMLAAGAVVSTPVIAQVKPNATAADVGLYAGPDRLQKLTGGAKKEGELTLYTSAQSDDMGALVGAYEKKYGVKVNVWRASSEKVLQRAVAEARANRNRWKSTRLNSSHSQISYAVFCLKKKKKKKIDSRASYQT